MCSRIRELDVCTNEPHAERTPKGTYHKKFAATQPVNQDNQPYKGDDSLNNTKDARGKKTIVGSLDANAFENCWRIVVNSIDTRSILP
jgi:hypothetical protein